jgi:extracellular factor (EF) 3-hydroxypalmitic acid methyl ester biosynthesis protein
MSALPVAMEPRTLLPFLDKALSCIASGDAPGGMDLLVRSLKKCRGARAPSVWRDESCPEIRSHPVREWLHQDPLTAHGFRKPRGYSGDAVLMDHIYGVSRLVAWPHPSTTAGKLYFCSTNAASSRALRYSRALMAKLIDGAAARRTAPRILALGAGHLREVELCRSAARGRYGRFGALDQDNSSLQVASADYDRLDIETANLPVESLQGNHFTGEFDLVYAAGLFDCLSGEIARRLAQLMFASLRPGGTMVYSNLLPHIDDAAYLEAMMDWWLAYRTQQELTALASGLPAQEIRSLSCTNDPDNHIAFVTIHRV